MKYWVAEFERDCTSCQDEHRSSRTKKVTTVEMVKNIYKMELDDRQLKVRELPDMLGISNVLYIAY